MHNIPHTAEAKAKMRVAKLGKHLSPATEFQKGKKNPYEEKRIQNIKRGEKHYKWSDNPSYSAIHAWIKKVLGKPMICENCGIAEINSRRMHWSNISGQYLRDISDWARLCVVCHFAIDDITNRAWKTRRRTNV